MPTMPLCSFLARFARSRDMLMSSLRVYNRLTVYAISRPSLLGANSVYRL